jgi:hypothetical protein
MSKLGLECGVCFEAFDHDEMIPRLLKCGHTFCTSCLSTLLKTDAHGGGDGGGGGGIRCPNDRLMTLCTSVAQLPPNYSLLDCLPNVETKSRPLISTSKVDLSLSTTNWHKAATDLAVDGVCFTVNVINADNRLHKVFHVQASKSNDVTSDLGVTVACGRQEKKKYDPKGFIYTLVRDSRISAIFEFDYPVNQLAQRVASLPLWVYEIHCPPEDPHIQFQIAHALADAEGVNPPKAIPYGVPTIASLSNEWLTKYPNHKLHHTCRDALLPFIRDNKWDQKDLQTPPYQVFLSDKGGTKLRELILDDPKLATDLIKHGGFSICLMWSNPSLLVVK